MSAFLVPCLDSFKREGIRERVSAISRAKDEKNEPESRLGASKITERRAGGGELDRKGST